MESPVADTLGGSKSRECSSRGDDVDFEDPDLGVVDLGDAPDAGDLGDEEFDFASADWRTLLILPPLLVTGILSACADESLSLLALVGLSRLALVGLSRLALVGLSRLALLNLRPVLVDLCSPFHRPKFLAACSASKPAGLYFE